MSTPVWIQEWKSWVAITTGAAVVPDGSTTTNLQLLIDNPGVGVQARVQRITTNHAPATDTPNNSNGMLRYYRKRGGVMYLLHEENIAAVDRTATVKGATVTWKETDGDPVLVVEPGDQIYVGSEIADPYHWDALGGLAAIPA